MANASQKTQGSRAALAATLAPEPEEGAEQETESEPTKVVQWVGTVTDCSRFRTITAADFLTVGVEHPDVTWDQADRMTLGQARVSEKAAQYLIEVESGFKLVKTDELAFAHRS